MDYESEDKIVTKNIIDRLFSRLSLRHLRAINIKVSMNIYKILYKYE